MGAICSAVDYLAKNGLLTNFKHTGNAQYLWKDFDQYQNKSDFFQEQTVRDHNLVTANGAAPLEFTKQVLKMIKFKNSEQIDKDIYLCEFGFYQFCKKVWQSILLIKLYHLSCLGGLTLKITCIFWVGKKSSLEHVIPEAIGINSFTTNTVCADYDGALGATIEIKREILELEGCKGNIPQVLRLGKDSNGNTIILDKDPGPKYIPKVTEKDNGFSVMANSKKETAQIIKKGKEAACSTEAYR